MKSVETVGLAGFRFYHYRLGVATMRFTTETNEVFQVEVPNMGALIPMKLDQNTKDDVKYVPSIIGNDFLEQQKCALYCNPSAKTVYLEFP
jgi:hypothetical protein